MKKIFVSFLGLFGYFFLRAYFITLRITFHVDPSARKALQEKKQGSIILLWHDSLFLLPLFSYLHKYNTGHVLISHSRDGDIPSFITEKFKGFHAIRVKGGLRHMAAKEALDVLESKQILFITPDGPRGPRHEIKPGYRFLAEKTDAQIFAFSWQGSRIHTFSTWDRFRLPLPFSRCQAKLVGPFSSDEISLKDMLG